MALIHWEPVTELNTIQNEMNRLFNTFFDEPNQTARGTSNGTMRRWLPPMDLVETTDHYVLRADLPGLSDRDVNVQLEDNVLTLSGKRKTEHEDQQEGYYRLERASGAFSRSLTLPDGVDPNGLQAHFERGVLEISIPKPEQRKPRKVAISIADSGPASTIEAGETHATNGANTPEPALARS
jgi:HSP20 family protein